jgi:hypothetical protein
VIRNFLFARDPGANPIILRQTVVATIATL